MTLADIRPELWTRIRFQVTVVVPSREIAQSLDRLDAKLSSLS